MKPRRIGQASLILGLLWSTGCSHEVKPASPDAGTAVRVNVADVVSREEEQVQALAGTLKVRRQATLASKLPGRILSLTVEEGDVVAAGALVVEIDASDLRARTQQATAARDSAVAQVQVSQAGYLQSLSALDQARSEWQTLRKQQSEAQARYDLARADAQRYQFLAKEGAVPRQRAEQAITELRVSESRLQQLKSQMATAQSGIRQSQAAIYQAQQGVHRTQAGVAEAEAGIDASSSDLSYAEVRAPFRGVVVEKMAYQGELNSPGRALVRLQDLDSLEASVPVPESLMERVQPGARLRLELTALKRTVDAKVRQIVASTDPSTRSFDVRLSLLQKPDKLFPGMYVKLKLPQARQTQTLVPQRALVHKGQLDGVYVVREGRAEFRLLQIGQPRPQEGLVQVLSGVGAGEEVVVSPPEDLRDGQKVQL